jgi:hypothetical protein
VTTYRYQNHTVRSEGWRYTRYADGGEELYDETADPYEWANLAQNPADAAQKASLGKWLPAENRPDIGNSPGNDGSGRGQKAKQKKAARSSKGR